MSHTRGLHVGESRICGDAGHHMTGPKAATGQEKKKRKTNNPSKKKKSRRSSHSVKRDDSAPIVRAVRAHCGSRPHGSPRMPILAAKGALAVGRVCEFGEFAWRWQSWFRFLVDHAESDESRTPISSDAKDSNTRSMLL